MARRRTRSKHSKKASGGGLLFILGILVGIGILFLAARGGLFSSQGSSSSDETRQEASSSGGSRPDRKESAEEAREDDETGPEKSTLASVVPAAHSTDTSKAAPVEAETEPGSEPAARIALVIDDLGRSMEDIDTLARLGVPVSYSVLPFEELTPEVVAELRKRGEEILCHLPMEARNGENPGPGALFLGMSPSQLRELTAAAIQAVPGAVGVNNHMGSGLTEDEGSMEAVLGAIAARKLFFLDSRTSAQSVGYRMAMDLGMPAAERQVFLDRDPKPEEIRAQFQRLLTVAKQRGAAIAIGHPYPSTLAVLAEEVPKAKAAGFEIVPVSYLLDRPGDADQ